MQLVSLFIGFYYGYAEMLSIQFRTLLPSGASINKMRFRNSGLKRNGIYLLILRVNWTKLKNMSYKANKIQTSHTYSSSLSKWISSYCYYLTIDPTIRFALLFEGSMLFPYSTNPWLMAMAVYFCKLNRHFEKFC